MKIATYNVWYSNIDKRAEQLFKAISNIDADIIGLQEVTTDFYEKLIANVKYPYHVYSAQDMNLSDNDFVAILSKHPICEHFTFVGNEEYGNINAQNAIIEVGGIRFSFTNVHLPWDSALAKEKHIVVLQKYIRAQKDKAHFFILAGDFNCGIDSSVHRFLLGDMSLRDCEAKPYWNDLSGIHAALNEYKTSPTLDCINNPRWRNEKLNWVPSVVDRIYLMECMEGQAWNYDWNIENVSIFGKDVSPKTKLAPSDHYGVLAEVEFAL
jgi:endonuclease/exonuclease/phosphatase family metal-dependent hydrolase